jgi:hypothetical protein
MAEDVNDYTQTGFTLSVNTYYVGPSVAFSGYIKRTAAQTREYLEEALNGNRLFDSTKTHFHEVAKEAELEGPSDDNYQLRDDTTTHKVLGHLIFIHDW